MYHPLSVYFLIFFWFFFCILSHRSEKPRIADKQILHILLCFFFAAPLHLDMMPIHVNPPRNTKGLSSHHSILSPPSHTSMEDYRHLHLHLHRLNLTLTLTLPPAYIYMSLYSIYTRCITVVYGSRKIRDVPLHFTSPVS